MDFLLNRYRNVTALAVAILAQLALLAYQIKSNQDVRLIRVWAVSAVTPMARVLEGGRSTVSHFFGDYFLLRRARDENNALKTEMNRVKMENQYLRAELSTADRAKTLAIFQSSSQSKTVAAHVIGNSTGSSGKVVFIDRGSTSGIEKGMAVITPDGIVGKVINVYANASQVLEITDPSFAAGVVSQKNRVHGTLKGQGHSTVMIDYVQNEKVVEQGEMFLTSGDDRIFPKGLPVGIVDVVRPGNARKEIFVIPSGLQNGLEEVLIITEGVHAQLPNLPTQSSSAPLLSAPPVEPGENADGLAARGGPGATDADRLIEHYRNIGAAQRHVYGERGGGAPNMNVPETQPPAGQPSSSRQPTSSGKQPAPAP